MAKASLSRTPEGQPNGSCLRVDSHFLEDNIRKTLEDPYVKSATEMLDLLLRAAQSGISRYLEHALESGKIDQQLFDEAKKQTFPNLREWLKDADIDDKLPKLPGHELSRFKEGILSAVEEARRGLEERQDLGGWERIVNAFRQQVRFGTGGIRGLMAFDRESIEELAKSIDAPILKGPNTINDLVFLLTSAGVAKYGRDRVPAFQKVVVGYDSRVGGQDLARLIARLFLKEGYTVYLFDEPCPYPEVTFAVPYAEIQADVGILISASHNDYRYNGYKLSCANGSQFDPEERDAMYNQYIKDARPKDVNLYDSLEQAPQGKLYYLGGDKVVEGTASQLIDLHARHREHVKQFFLTPDLAERQSRSRDPLRIGFCAFHGAGRIAVPRLLKEVGFRDVKIIHGKKIGDRENRPQDWLGELNGLFPAFNSNEGQEQQPDPGDPRSGEIMVEAFKGDYPGEFEHTDIIIGTDPDADRCGVVVKVPADQRKLYPKRYIIQENKQADPKRFGYAIPVPKEQQSRYPLNDYTLLPADDAWALLLWYRLKREADNNGGRIPDADKKFITLSHTTSDSIARLARKYGIGVVRTWVGFASLAAATRDVWQGKIEEITHLVDGRSSDTSREYVKKELCHPFVCDCQGIDANRSFNIGAMEQSNGFSILGGPPRTPRSLGEGGHVRDKDGTFAALLVAEVAAWAKDQEKPTTLFELIDQKIYLDPDVGLFVNLYEPDPLDGEYPGIEGDRQKKAILRRALGCFQFALAGGFDIGGVPVTSAVIYRTGKYDVIYPPTYEFLFPDEGIRFFFDSERLDHLTIRPSGTGNALRFHIQLHENRIPDQNTLIEKKEELHRKGEAIMDGIRKLLKAPRH